LCAARRTGTISAWPPVVVVVARARAFRLPDRSADLRRCAPAASAMPLPMDLVVHPLTPARWPDLEAVFEARGCSVARGCWCMYYRRSGSRTAPPPGTSAAEAGRAALKALVDAGRPPGLLGYHGRTPVGWVSLGPREDYARLARSPVMKPVDERPVWSIVCFVVPAAYRGQGVAHALLAGAIRYARRQGATLLEGYPVDKAECSADDALWFGTKSMFDAAGFEEVARRRPRRPVVRLRPA
jgi:GNAT superfamily N-acetyltransferase